MSKLGTLFGRRPDRVPEVSVMTSSSGLLTMVAVFLDAVAAVRSDTLAVASVEVSTATRCDSSTVAM